MLTLTPDSALLSPRYYFMVANPVSVKVIIFSTTPTYSKLENLINNNN